MADASALEIEAAYQEVRSASDTNWLLVDYEVQYFLLNDRSDRLVLTSTGTGGLSELQNTLDDARASFAYVRVQYSNDKESQREKFILVVWIGKNVKIMRRAKISVHSADVKQVLRAYSLDVSASSKDDLVETQIITRLRKAGGASYDGV